MTSRTSASQRRLHRAKTAPWLAVAVFMGAHALAGFLPAQEKPETTKPDPDKPAKAEAAAEEPETGIFLVSKTSSPKVYAPIKGAKVTVMAPAYVGKYGIRMYSKEAWRDGRYVWNKVYDAAVKQADAIVDSLEPQFKRDTRGVLDYAIIEHESPWLSSVLLSRRFLPRFEREFGERLHVIVIDRHRMFVFPADGGELANYAPALADLYHDDSVVRHPISLEIFLIDKSGFQVVGSIED